jgi:cold shock protein
VGVVAVGRIVRFDEVRGYGFIAPSAGGEDVFVHLNDFAEQRHLVRPGISVEFEVEEGERGLKASSVRVLTSSARPRSAADHPVSAEAGPRAASVGDDDGMCDVLAMSSFLSEITELLIRDVPSLTGGDIARLRERLADYAASHGWVDV